MSRIVHVDRTNIVSATIADQPLPALAEHGVRLAVQSFAVTANNVTYAVAGDMLGYWNFFPAPQGKGVVPMWGHAVVVESCHPDILVGERVYGYMPMGTHLDVLPDRIRVGQFVDATAHRQPMAAIYNTYSRLAADPEHDPAREAERMIFGPLFKTGFLLESMFRRQGWHGAGTVIMTSASSKTALAMASVARDGSPAIRRIGLTSTPNLTFVRESGLYDEVLDYGEIASLAPVASVSVDFAGNGSIRREIHTVLGDYLAYSCLVGVTHVDARDAATDAPLPGPKPVFFFAPDEAAAAINAAGPKAFADAVAERWHAFLSEVAGVVQVDRNNGLESAMQAFVATVKGQTNPSRGIVIELD